MSPTRSILQAFASGEMHIQLPNIVENIYFSFPRGVRFGPDSEINRLTRSTSQCKGWDRSECASEQRKKW